MTGGSVVVSTTGGRVRMGGSAVIGVPTIMSVISWRGKRECCMMRKDGLQKQSYRTGKALDVG